MLAPRFPDGRRVLIVDDCQDTTTSLALLLQHFGHEVRVAHDGPAALGLAEAFQPDTVILDIGLPGMDGWEVTRRIRKLPEGGSMFVVVVSGYGRDEDRERSAQAGCDLHLLKPALYSDLEFLLQRRSSQARHA